MSETGKLSGDHFSKGRSPFYSHPPEFSVSFERPRGDLFQVVLLESAGREKNKEKSFREVFKLCKLSSSLQISPILMVQKNLVPLLTSLATSLEHCSKWGTFPFEFLIGTCLTFYVL